MGLKWRARDWIASGGASAPSADGTPGRSAQLDTRGDGTTTARHRVTGLTLPGSASAHARAGAYLHAEKTTNASGNPTAPMMRIARPAAHR